MAGIYILLVVLAYFGLLWGISLLTSKGGKGNDAFFRGSRCSPWYVVSFGMIGASLSGVTFVSVPGMVGGIDMTYMQTVLGFFVGYIIIAHVLLPLYYKLQLTTIYTYLKQRIGTYTYKTGASFFLLSKIIGAAARLYLVCVILQHHVFDALGVPFVATVVAILLLIWLYTRQGGIRTIVWTDTLQTFCLLAALAMIVWKACSMLGLDFHGMTQAIAADPHSHLFEFADWHSKQHFAKQFLSGIFITIVMTGLDQDMMQKSLTCKNLRDAQKNMYCYGLSFVPVNFVFLCLGILLLMLSHQTGDGQAAVGDALLPSFAATGLMGTGVLVCFTIGIIAAAFSSADSAITALTTCFCIDLMGMERKNQVHAERQRRRVHFYITAMFAGLILLFRAANSQSIIDAIYVVASYTYGPLLGVFAFGLFTPWHPRDRYVPYVCIASPFICHGLKVLVATHTGYEFGYELLMLNGLLTMAGLALLSLHNPIGGKQTGSTLT